MTRRRFVYSLLATSGIAASYPCYFEPRWLAVTRPEVTLSRVRLPEPVRILHLSDLHLSLPVPLSLINNAITLGLEQQPDVICLTGDFITSHEDLSSGDYARALSRLSAAAPTFAVLGNHDGGSWAAAIGGYTDSRVVRRLLGTAGVRLLHNTSARISIRSASLSVIGLGDLWSAEVNAQAAFSSIRTQEPVILLAHNPDHRWYYYSDMTRDEAIVFKTSESDPNRAQLMPHGAFDNPLAGPDAPARVSLEMRGTCYWFG